MSYSYISPRKKSLFTKDFWLMLTFFSITIVMIFGAYGFLLFSDNQFKNQKIQMLSQNEQLQKDIKTTKSKIAVVEKQSSVAQHIFTRNGVLRDSIKNLFDLIPNTITLSEAQITSNALILSGITPNQDVYNFMLQAPLRSIFHRTYSSFYPAQNGWLNFVSTNYLDEELINE